MSSLTEEQKRKIEENKQKALAIRAARSASASPAAKNASATPASPATPSPNKYDSRTPKVTVEFTLISRDSFGFKFRERFNKSLVEAFETISNKLYDSEKARWSFPLSEYNKVKNILKQMKELLIEVIPLPKYIEKIFLYHSTRQNVDHHKSIDISRVNEVLLDKLFPFQKEGVQFGVSKKGRCIIADDMGLGKTIQALGIAHYYYDDWPLLIVCPSSMKYQWEQEIINNLPCVPSSRILVMKNGKQKMDKPLVLIISYPLMSKIKKRLIDLRFEVIIFDESHAIKNYKADRTRTALELSSQARRRILLSGTPALSRPIELYNQLRAIEPGFFSSIEFGIRYCDGRNGLYGWEFDGCSNMEELRTLLEEKFMIRRLKAAVLNDLPPKMRQVLILDDELIESNKKEMNNFARKMNDEKISKKERRECLFKYYAESARAKLKAIKDHVCQLLETGNKFLLFAYHREVFDEVCKLLEEKETYYIRIDGSVSSDARKSYCDQFQTEERFKVAVLSIVAASTGLTLTAANLVVFAELFWNPGILIQAEDRVHRIGQKNSVHIQYLLAQNTIDYYLWSLINKKLDVLNQTGLSEDDLTCEHIFMERSNESFMDLFGDMNNMDQDTSRIQNQVEETEPKRIKLDQGELSSNLDDTSNQL